MPFTTYPAIDRALQPPPGSESFKDSTTIPSEYIITSEDENVSGMPHRDSIGNSSSSSWPTEEVHAPELERPPETQTHSSVESKMSYAWTEEKENVCFCS